MADEIEDLDSTTQDTDQTEETLETTAEETIEETDDVDALKERNKQLFERAKKAEAEAKKLKAQPKVEPKPVIHSGPAISEEDIDKKLDEKLEKRELDSLDISDTLKKEVQNYAKLNGVSIKKALASDYIQFQKEKEEKAQDAEDASLGGGKKRSTTAKKDWSQVENPTFDLRTEQGKKDKAEFDEWAKKQLG